MPIVSCHSCNSKEIPSQQPDVQAARVARRWRPSPERPTRRALSFEKGEHQWLI
jgi:hypothetical protein